MGFPLTENPVNAVSTPVALACIGVTVTLPAPETCKVGTLIVAFESVTSVAPADAVTPEIPAPLIAEAIFLASSNCVWAGVREPAFRPVTLISVPPITTLKSAKAADAVAASAG